MDELLKRMDFLTQAPYQRLSTRISLSLDHAAHILASFFILLLVGSAVSLALSIGGFSELLAEFSFLCISAAAVTEVISMLILPAKRKQAL